MAVYSINDVEKLSGLKAHTLRVWEKRYNIIPNRRSNNNVRHYLEEDLKLILNIALLNKNGHKISIIAKMSQEEIAQKVAGYCNVIGEYKDQIDGLTLSMLELNEFKFSKIINHHTNGKGFELTMEQIIYPFLEKVNCMCSGGSLSQVHVRFIENIIKRKVICEIDNIPISTEGEALRYLIYLPEGSQYELGILFLYYVLRLQKVNVLYLGSNIPMNGVLEAYRIHNPCHILTILNVDMKKKEVQQYLSELASHTGNTNIGISGCPSLASKVKFPETVCFFKTLADIKNKFCRRS